MIVLQVELFIHAHFIISHSVDDYALLFVAHTKPLLGVISHEITGLVIQLFLVFVQNFHAFVCKVYCEDAVDLAEDNLMALFALFVKEMELHANVFENLNISDDHPVLLFKFGSVHFLENEKLICLKPISDELFATQRLLILHQR